MLQNVVQYLAHKENVRHNQRSEELSGEQNRINDSHYQRMDAETNRSNLAREAENYRSNRAKEDETNRHNLVTESQGWKQVDSQAALNDAKTAQQKKETDIYDEYGEGQVRADIFLKEEQKLNQAAQSSYTQAQDRVFNEKHAQGWVSSIGGALGGLGRLVSSFK